MLKKIFALILLLFIVGCSTTVTNYEIDYYTNQCQDHGGLREIYKERSPINRNVCTCQDGTIFKFKCK